VLTLPRVLFEASNPSAAARLRPNYSSFTRYYDFLVGDPAHGALVRSFLHQGGRFLRSARSLADVGCGTGRFLAWLAGSSLTLYGIDKSTEALAVARQRLEPGRAILLKQDIRSVVLPEPVDIVTCHNQTINYLLSAQDMSRSFAAIIRNLKTPGAFFFDFIARPTEQTQTQPTQSVEVVRLPDVTARFESLIDSAQTQSKVIVTFLPEGGRGPAREIHRQRWYRARSIARLLRHAGFGHIDVQPVSPSGPPQWLYVTALRQ
jgi:SAM-dependent methyltransferase